MARNKIVFLLIFALFLFIGICWAEKEDFKIVDSTSSPSVTAPNAATNIPPASNTPDASAPVASTQAIPEPPPILTKADNTTYIDPTNYTLGPDDVIQIDVQRHPEFSGIFPVNLEGKIQLKFAGDIEVTGLTKKALEQKIKNTISNYVINPDVTVTILDYKSKVIYVLGEVGAPGKYYMRAETIPVREALVQAGLPTLSAAMRRCRVITPDKDGKAKIKEVDVYSLLYRGDLTKNLDMHAGDVLYVPATVMAKIITVINPVTTAVGVSTAGPSGAKSAVSNLSGKTGF
mgnify:CR=1 FL=1